MVKNPMNMTPATVDLLLRLARGTGSIAFRSLNLADQNRAHALGDRRFLEFDENQRRIRITNAGRDAAKKKRESARRV